MAMLGKALVMESGMTTNPFSKPTTHHSTPSSIILQCGNVWKIAIRFRAVSKIHLSLFFSPNALPSYSQRHYCCAYCKCPPTVSNCSSGEDETASTHFRYLILLFHSLLLSFSIVSPIDCGTYDLTCFSVEDSCIHRFTHSQIAGIANAVITGKKEHPT